jgi:hypothetical protein
VTPPPRSVVVFEWMIVMGTIFCFVSLFSGSFDPQGGLETMISTDLYGQPALPDAARPMYRFVFALFAWISVVTFVMEWGIVRFALRRGEAWAFWVLLVGHVLWSIGAVGIAFATGARSYLWSAAIVSAITLPPFLFMRKAIAKAS